MPFPFPSQRRSSGDRLPRQLVLMALWLACGMPLARAQTQLEVTIGPAHFQVEVARTLEERQQGLMFRTSMPADHGMLFIQPEAGPTAFWMKNTYIPLDLLYFDAQKRLLEIYANVPPCTAMPCPIYASQAAVKYVLELNAGSADHLDLNPGDQFSLH